MWKKTQGVVKFEGRENLTKLKIIIQVDFIPHFMGSSLYACELLVGGSVLRGMSVII